MTRLTSRRGRWVSLALFVAIGACSSTQTSIKTRDADNGPLVPAGDRRGTPRPEGRAPAGDAAGAAPAMVHRGYLGWVGDLRRTHLVGVPWPSIAIDATLEADYLDTLDALVANGQNEFSVWGLFTGDNWSPEIDKTIDATRAGLVRTFIEAAHARKLRVLCGMGVYSWGFAKIMDAHPETRCASNGRVMSLASAAAWEWQKKVLDYALDNFAFDGISFQPADLGRCNDGDLGKQGDEEYYASLTVKTAAYVRAKNPKLLMGLSGWGINFGVPGSMAQYKRMGGAVDYLIDVEASSLRGGAAHRKELIKQIAPATFGTIGSPNVEPIQGYPRDRYFVPTLLRTAKDMGDAFADGARAAETYARTRGNPGDEVSMVFLGQLESKGFDKPEAALNDVLGQLYAPKDTAALTELSAIFTQAEAAFFAQAGSPQIILLAARDMTTFSPSRSLFASWSATARKTYYDAIVKLRVRAEALAPSIGNATKMNILMTTLKNFEADLKTLAAS